jgi:hypothetical protein
MPSMGAGSYSVSAFFRSCGTGMTWGCLPTGWKSLCQTIWVRLLPSRRSWAALFASIQ